MAALFSSIASAFQSDPFAGKRVSTHEEETPPITRDATERLKPGPKPSGFWYSYGTEWMQFMGEEYQEKLATSQYASAIDVDETQILRISTADELVRFTAFYGVPEAITDSDPEWEESRKLMLGCIKVAKIEWQLVGKHYSGIEIIPYIAERSLFTTWYSGWDVATGCIWNPGAITGYRPLSSNVPEYVRRHWKSIFEGWQEPDEGGTGARPPPARAATKQRAVPAAVSASMP